MSRNVKTQAAVDPNYIEVAYSHYRIRWSKTHWSLYRVSDGKWIRLDAQRLDTHPIGLTQLTQMCNRHMSGMDPAHLYAAVTTAAKSSAKPRLQAVPSEPVVATPTRAEKRAAAKAERERAEDIAGEREILRLKLIEDAEKQAARDAARTPRKPRVQAAAVQAAAPVASQPVAATDTTAATMRALDVALAAIAAAQTLIAQR